MINARAMLKEYLGSHGYAGLYRFEDACGCGLEDFAPCGEGPFPECVAARCAVVPPDGEVRIDEVPVHHGVSPWGLVYFPANLEP